MSGERSFRVLIPAGRVEGGPTPSEDSESSTLCRLSRAGANGSDEADEYEARVTWRRARLLCLLWVAN